MRKPVERIPNLSAAILAGGKSRRMGKNKALLLFRGAPLIGHVYGTLTPLFEEIFLVSDTPDAFAFLPCPKIPDRIPGKGPMSGIDAALRHSLHPYVLAVGCDAPFLSPSLLKLLAGKIEGVDLVIPCGPNGPEPLCAVYGKGCLPILGDSLRKGELQLAALACRVKSRIVPPEEVTAVDPGFRSFRNLNTPADFRYFSEEEP